MDPSDVIAGASAVVASVALYVAVLAYRRTREAVELQRRADARVGEHRDVRLSAGWLLISPFDSDAPGFAITNHGTTAAYNLRLVLELPESRDRFTTKHLGPGQTVEYEVVSLPPGALGSDIRVMRDTQYSIHWTSENGHPDEFRYSRQRPMQLG